MKKKRLWSNCCNFLVLLLILIPGLTWAGSISGFVRDNVTGNPVQNLTVNAHDWVTDQWHGNGFSQSDGSYTISGLDAGTYRLVAHSNGTEYLQTYYNNTPDFDAATQVLLGTNDDDLVGYDFDVPLGGSIAGTVGVDPGGAPITGFTVRAYSYESGVFCGSTITDANGDYRIGGLAGGNYRVVVLSGVSYYVGEYYDNVIDGDNAAPVSVNLGAESGDIDFALSTGGRIHGRVTEEDGTTPVPNCSVQANTYNIGYWAGSTMTDSNGDYVIGGLPAGTYRVRTYPHGTGLAGEYYSETYSYNDASPVNVTTGGDTSNIDFTLAIGGTISGYVYQQDGTTPISGMNINIYLDRCHNGHLMGVQTNENGYFEFTELPLGTQFILRADSNSTGQYYISQWYDNLTDSEDCNQATFVTVGEFVDFSLTLGGAVSGSVKDNNGTAITEVSVGVDVIDGDPCGNHQVISGVWTDSADGTFTVSGVPAGTYYLRTYPAQSNYVSEWLTSTYGSQDCSAAESFIVAVGEMVSGLEFRLEEGGTISGQVTQASDSQPIANAWVMAHHYDTNNWGNNAQTDAQGYYAIKGLPDGDFRVQVDTWNINLNVLEEFYNDVHDWDTASRVPVTASGTTSNIDMALDYGFAHEVSVMNIHQPGDTFQTYYSFYPHDFVGTLPDDISSVTVETPVSHTIHDLVWDATWNEFAAVLEGSPELGVHVFTATTAEGQVVSTDFQYVVQTIPNPNAAAMTPAGGAVVSSKTPSFIWEPVDLTGVPLYYRFEVVDDTTGLRVWASSRTLGMTSITLREGLLTPGGSYRWRVRVTDSDNWVEVQNRANSAWVHFTVPATLDAHDALPAIDPANWNGMTWIGGDAFACSVKVIDLDGVAFDGSSHTLTVTAPDGFNFPDGQHVKTVGFDFPDGPTAGYYWLHVGGETPASGEYTFTVTDPDGNQTTFVEQVDVNPLNGPDETSLAPSNIDEYISATFDNVYVNGQLYETFTLTDVNQLEPTKWRGINEVDIVDNRLEVDLNSSVGRAHGGIQFTHIEPITSVQADITVTSISDSPTFKGARIAGSFFNDGSNADFWVYLFNDGSQVRYSLSKAWFNHQGNYRWETIQSENLVAAAVGDLVTMGVAWNEGTKTLTFSANNQTQVLSNTIDYVHAGPVYPTIDNEMGLMARINLTTNSTPTFTWDPVLGASRYRVRIFTYNNSQTVWKGYTGSETSITVPPGVLEPDSYYRYRVEAWDAPSPFGIDNFGRTPVSSSDYYRFYTNSEVPEAPSIDLNGGGVQTVQSDEVGIISSFWVRVSDRQSVPDNIASVKVRFPSGYEESLNLDHTDGPYRGYYLSESDEAVETGVYTFTVTDNDGNTATITDDLVYDPIGYPAAGSLTATVTSKEIEVSWNPVSEAAFYRLCVYNEAYEQIYRIAVDAAEGSSVNIPRGLLEEGMLYRFRVKTYREFYSDITGSDTEGNNDNASSIPWQSSQYPTFTLSPDSDGDGLANTLERAICTDPDDADTDDDGIIDGLEDANLNGEVDTGETDPCNSDTDGDDIQDGTETGLTSDDIGPDTDTNIFVPDADPTTTTDPTLADSDGDGMSDGEEDANQNGQVDEGESDPNKKRVTALPFIPLLLLE